MPSKSHEEELLKKLLEDREALLRSIEDKTAQINDLYIDKNIGDDGDRAEVNSVDFKETSIIASQQERILQINDAIASINNNTYGKCLMCDEKIPIDRLRAKPFAKYCINCREEYEKSMATRR